MFHLIRITWYRIAERRIHMLNGWIYKTYVAMLLDVSPSYITVTSYSVFILIFTYYLLQTQLFQLL